MNATVSKIWGQIKEFVEKINPKTRKILLVVLCLIVALSVILAIILNSKPYETLFSGLNEQEQTEIAGKLLEMGASYKIDGSDILVLKDEEPGLKAQLISEGYPKSGLTYNTFTSNIGMMSTDFEKRQFLIFDLQDRMAAVIRSMSGVKDATVTIGLGEEQRYVLQSDVTEATASVWVTMQNGGSPSIEQVNGIQVLVAGGIPGLRQENIKVVDGNGREVSASTGVTSQIGITTLKLQLEEEYAASIEQKVRHMLNSMYGDDKVQVTANATFDVDNKIKEIVTYVPSEDNKGVLTSEGRYQEIVRGEGEEGGVVGTESNAEVPIYPEITTDGTEVYYTSDEQLEYLVSYIKEQVQAESGILTDLRVSVTVDKAQEAEATTQEVRRLIANTAGITMENIDTKIALVYYQSDSGTIGGDGPGATDPDYVFLNFTLEELILIGSGIFIFMIIIILILVLVGKGKQKKAVEQATYDAPFVEQPVGDILDISLRDLPNTREKELKEQIGDFTDENPEISAQLIRTWLRGVEE